MRNKARVFTDDEVADMAALWCDGTSQVEIANILGTTQPVVSRVLRPFDFKRHQVGIGPAAPGWRGGRISTSGGYSAVWVSPDSEYAAMRTRTGYVLEHRLEMAKSLGRALAGDENVHHINGIRDDNRIENLELWMTKQPKGIRGTDRHCTTCTCGTED